MWRNISTTVWVIFLSCSFAGAAEIQRDDFEGGNVAGWSTDGKSATVDSQDAHGGAGSLRLKLPSGGSRKIISLPPAKSSSMRLLRVRLFTRSRNVKPGTARVWLLLGFAPPRRPAWFNPDDPHHPQRLGLLPTANDWTEVTLTAFLKPDVRTVTLYLLAEPEGKDADIWFDDICVELLDRGLLLETPEEGNIYTTESATMDVIVSGAESLKEGRAVLRDEAGQPLGTTSIPRGAKTVQVKLPTRGYYDLRLRATYDDGVQYTQHTSAAVLGPLIPDALRMASPFGFQHGYPELENKAGGRWRRLYIGADRDWIRKQADKGFPLSSIETKLLPPNQRSTMLWCYIIQPLWLQDRNGAPIPKNPQDLYPINNPKTFRQLIRWEIARRSGQPFEYFELANEPLCSWKGTVPELVEYFALLSSAARSADPKIKIVGPSFCSIGPGKMQTLDQMIKLGFLKHIDVLGMHNYVKSTPPEAEFLERLRKLKAYLKSIGRADMPIFNTEYGWTSPPGDLQKPVSELTRARYCSRSLVLQIAEGIDQITYFKTRCHSQFDRSHGYAILNHPSKTPRPGYAAYANTVRYLTGAEGPAKLLELTPTTYLALFAKKGNTIAVAWTTKGEAKVFLPGPWTSARSMTGRPIATPTDGLVTVSESPTFIVLPDTSLYDIRIGAKSRRISQAQRIKTGLQPVWIPSPLSVSNGTLSAPANAPAGTYHLLRKTKQGYRATPVEVIAPLEFISTNYAWPVGTPAPRAEVTLRSNLPKAARLQVQAKLNNAKAINIPDASLAPGKTAVIAIPLAGLREGQRYRGQLNVRTANGKARLTLPLDVTPLSCQPLKQKPKAPPVDISAWGPFGGSDNAPRTIPAANCSATLQTAYDDRGLHVLVTVRDDKHRQGKRPAEMWKEDSIQLSFDMDAAKPWEPVPFGFNGHVKVFEYGFGLGKKGPMSWRWISADPTLPAAVAEKRIRKHIARKGDTTTYKLLFPWPTLGLKSKPNPGTIIGFSMVVNDTDTNGQRNGLKLFGGIIDKKDPAKFGTLYLR